MINNQLDKAVKYFIEHPAMLKSTNSRFTEGRYGKEIFKGQDLDFVCTAKQMAKDLQHFDEVANLCNNISALEDIIKSYDEQNSTLKSETLLNYEPKTHQELYELHKIDPKVYKITNYWTKLKSTGKFTSSVFCKKLSDNDVEKVSNDLMAFLEQYQPKFLLTTKADILQNDVFTRPTCLLISIADFHLDKRTLDGKNILEKVELYKKVINNLVYKAYRSHLIEEIVYITSNDFMHVDTYQETTTKLTQQQTTNPWYDSYEVGFDLQVEVISKLRQFCNKLTVIHISSNHARTKEFYMVHALEVMFRNDENIVFNRTAEPTKCFTYGNNFIGMHHGDVKDYNQLPTYFASKYRKEWGSAQFAEIALADKHHRKEWKHSLTKNEVHGTRMFICPSLSGEDLWHKDNMYDLAIKASIARVYDAETGFCTEFEERV